MALRAAVGRVQRSIVRVYVEDGTSEAKVTVAATPVITVTELCEKIAKKRGLAPGYHHSLWLETSAGEQQLLNGDEFPVQLQQQEGEGECRLVFKEEVVKHEDEPPTFEHPLCPVCRQLMARPMTGLCGHVVCEECLIVKNLALCPTCGDLVKMEDYVPCHLLNIILKQLALRRARLAGTVNAHNRTIVQKRGTVGLSPCVSYRSLLQKPLVQNVHGEAIQAVAGAEDFSHIDDEFEYKSFLNAGGIAQFWGDSRMGASSARLRTLNSLITLADRVVKLILAATASTASAGRFKSYYSQHDLYPELTEAKLKEKKHPLWSKVHYIVLRKMKEYKYLFETLNSDPKTGKKYTSFDPKHTRYQVTFS